MDDLHKIWPHRWVNSKAKSFHSPIEGRGVVAIENINKNEIALVYGGITVPITDIEKYREKMGYVGLQISDNFFICPTSQDELEKTGVVNHSCEPNLGFKSPIEVIAIRDIPSGEELTLDYAFCETLFQPFKCNCQADSCRKVIKQNDWQIKSIQEKYGQYFSPYLKSKI